MRNDNMKMQNDDPNKNTDNKPWMYLVVVVILIGFAICAYSITRVDSINKEQNDKNLANSSISVTPSTQLSTNTTISPSNSVVTPYPDVTGLPTITKLPSPTLTQAPGSNPTDEAVNVNAMRTPTVVKGVYVPAGTAGSGKIDDLMTLAASTEVNAFVIDVKGDNGRISYQMNQEMVKKIGANTHTIKDIKSLIKKLKSNKIYLIARIVAFKDPYLADKRHDFAIKNKDGTLYQDNNKQHWVNPYNKEVWKYLVGVASQAAKDGFDEIQFDYIRFSTGEAMKKVDFGEAAKHKSKEQIITEFTKYACEKLHPLGVYVSADVYGAIINSAIDSSIVGQNYQSMARYLDYICPMIYPSHFGEGNYGIKYPDTKPYDLIYKVLTKSEEKLNQLPNGTRRAGVRPWLQDFTANWITHHIEYGPDEVRAQINGVYDAGYGEWMLWNSACSYSSSGLLKN